MSMRSNRMKIIALGIAWVILASTSCQMAPSNLSGRWKGHMEYNEGGKQNSPVTLLLVQNGQGVTGTLRWDRADHVLVEFTISTGVVAADGEIALDGNGGNALFTVPMTFEGKVQGNTIRGTVKMRVSTGLLGGGVTTETGQLSVEKD